MNKKIKILYINPSNKECGIYQFGMRVYKALESYLPNYCDWELFYDENYNDVGLHHRHIEKYQPDIILYSHHSTALPFADEYMNNPDPNIIHIGVTHEQEQVMLDNPNKNRTWYGGSLFQNWIGHDPTLVLNADNVHNATRPILRSEWKPVQKEDNRIVFGNSGFGFRRKMHREIVQAIQNEFDEAVIRFNMPPSHFGDKHLVEASQIAEECRGLIRKSGIELKVTFNLLETEEEIVEWLYGNDVNIYFFGQQPVPNMMRGVSSSPDNALSTRRPLIVNQSTMMKHLNPIFGAYGVDGDIRTLLDRQARYKNPNSKTTKMEYSTISLQRMECGKNCRRLL